jgi:hypothetical protein
MSFVYIPTAVYKGDYDPIGLFSSLKPAIRAAKACFKAGRRVEDINRRRSHDVIVKKVAVNSSFDLHFCNEENVYSARLNTTDIPYDYRDFLFQWFDDELSDDECCYGAD